METERELARQSWSEWMVPWRLGTVRKHEAPGRWKERLLLWKVRDEEWVVAAPDGQVYVEEFRSWVDAFSGN